MNWMLALSLGLTLSTCYVVLCRVEKMVRGVTKPIIFYQHAALALGFFLSFILSFTQWADLAEAASAGGVLMFFGMSAGRWRVSAPEDTSTKPGVLDLNDDLHASRAASHRSS